MGDTKETLRVTLHETLSGESVHSRMGDTKVDPQETLSEREVSQMGDTKENLQETLHETPSGESVHSEMGDTKENLQGPLTEKIVQLLIQHPYYPDRRFQCEIDNVVTAFNMAPSIERQLEMKKELCVLLAKIGLVYCHPKSDKMGSVLKSLCRSDVFRVRPAGPNKRAYQVMLETLQYLRKCIIDVNHLNAAISSVRNANVGRFRQILAEYITSIVLDVVESVRNTDPFLFTHFGDSSTFEKAETVLLNRVWNIIDSINASSNNREQYVQSFRTPQNMFLKTRFALTGVVFASIYD
jgi:hypothetical protein